jgi:putative PIN family toxin of toxin-antitoxin system
MGQKVVIDTNVIISGFGWDGLARKAVWKALDCEWYISRKQLSEVERVLTYPRLGRVPGSVLTFLYKYCQIIEIKGEKYINDSDDMLIETALISSAVLVTGDKELLRFKGCKVVSVRGFTEKFK